MKSPYQDKFINTVGSSLELDLFIKTPTSKYRQIVFFNDKQFEKLCEFLEEMFPPTGDVGIIEFIVEDELYEVKKIVDN